VSHRRMTNDQLPMTKQGSETWFLRLHNHRQ
jgi:hypothetical protein